MWRTAIVVGAVALAASCALEEPQTVELEGGSWPEADVESLAEEVEPEVEPIAWYPICVEHYKCCQDTKLGNIRDAPRKTRCAFCSEVCHDEQVGRGRWPDRTRSGRDCQYWKRKYEIEPPTQMCRELPQ
jgi:hypothetical protein